VAERKLTKQAQIFVVQQLAMFERPSIVQAALKETFGVEVALPAILHYDLSNPELESKWRELFDETRDKFLADTSAIPIANKAFRLKELDSIYHSQKLAKMQNPIEMRAVLEQAAKESGGQYTNRQELALDVSNLTDEELEAVAKAKG
jgi:hypothetical protein